MRTAAAGSRTFIGVLRRGCGVLRRGCGSRDGKRIRLDTSRPYHGGRWSGLCFGQHASSWSALSSSSHLSQRPFSTTSNRQDDDDDDDGGKVMTNSKNNHQPTNKITSSFSPTTDGAREIADITARGIGQVIFLNSRRSGAIILASLAVGDPFLAALAGCGALTSTATARVVDLDADAAGAGLWTYNGCLVGCAAAVFCSPWPAVAFAFAGASASTATAACLKPALGKMPQWTLAFNAVTLVHLARLRPLAGSAEVVDAATAAAKATSADVSTVGMWDVVVSAPLHGLSQIFVVENVVTGAGILVAIASYSPALALHALGGAAAGSATGWIAGADPSDVVAGLWGYNSALTSMGVAVFFRPTKDGGGGAGGGMRWLSLYGAVATAFVTGAMQPLFAAGGMPCLTMPFCTVMSACYFMADTTPYLSLAKNPHSPEQNAKH